MDNKLRIRPYRSGDAAQIIKWCKDEQAFYKWSAGIYGEYPITEERLNKMTSDRLSNSKYFPFVAFDNEGVKGFFTLRLPEASDEIMRFGFVIVAPEVRGKGYGKQMLRLGLRFAFELYGARMVTLGVFENNPAAHFCYRAVGFRDVENMTETYNILGEDWVSQEMVIFSDNTY